jgi:hypothetical protein
VKESEAAKVVAVLSAAFPDAKWGEDTVAAYEAALEPHEYDVAQAAVRRIMASLKFRPSIAELVNACVDVQLGTKKTGLEAWEELCLTIRHVGQYRVPKFDDPLVERAMEQIGGWRYVCQSENEASDRARFAEAYDTMVDKERVNIASGVPLLSEGKRQPSLLGTSLRELTPPGSTTPSTT